MFSLSGAISMPFFNIFLFTYKKFTNINLAARISLFLFLFLLIKKKYKILFEQK